VAQLNLLLKRIAPLLAGELVVRAITIAIELVFMSVRWITPVLLAIDLDHLYFKI
jgi:hypothetical protein